MCLRGEATASQIEPVLPASIARLLGYAEITPRHLDALWLNALDWSTDEIA